MHSKINVSLIVPIYNNSEHLERLIEVLHNQTFRDCEFLLINDGSNDDSLKILKRVLKHLDDNRFKIFNKNNGGVSSARNFGLEHAAGKYIMFMDADDVCDKDYIEKYYKDIHYNKVDISFFGIKIVDENGKLKKIPKMEALSIQGIIGASEIIRLYSSQELRGYSFIYISKKELWNQVKFNENISYQEDCLALMQLVIRNPDIKVHMNREIYYSYVINSKSITHNMDSKYYEQAILVNKIISNELENSSAFYMLAGSMRAHDLTNISSLIGFALLNKKREVYRKARYIYISCYEKNIMYIEKSYKKHRSIQYWLIKNNLTFILTLIYSFKMK